MSVFSSQVYLLLLSTLIATKLILELLLILGFDPADDVGNLADGDLFSQN